MTTVTPVEAGALGEPEQPPPRTSNVPAAVLWMIGTLLSFSLMAISIRQLGGTLNLFELLMVRAVGGLIDPACRDGGCSPRCSATSRCASPARISFATARISSRTCAGQMP